jgi:VWFA-related protein
MRIRTANSGGILGALLFAASAYAQAPEGPMTPQPGVEIQKAPPERTLKLRSILVNTPVTVRNAKGEMIHNLEQSAFRITDNGVPQTITHFNLGGDPVSLVVVVETSSRIESLMPELHKIGILLTQAVTGPTGETAIVSFDDSVDKRTDFTTDAEKVEKSMSGLVTGYSGAKLYDAMALAVEMLSAQPEVSATDLGHRRVMLVIAEARDEGSKAKLGEVLRQAQLQNITIYSVGLSSMRAAMQKKPEYKRPPSMTSEGTFGLPPQPGVPQTPTTEDQRYGGADLLGLAVWAVSNAANLSRSKRRSMEVAATATGGAHYAAWKDRTIEQALDEIGGELHAQYTLSYTPSGELANGYHEISVTVDRPDLNVRSRPGYYLSAPGS